MKYEHIIVGAIETNCYLVCCEETKECAVIDPGAEAQKIIQLIHQNDLKPTMVINTHGHVDHVGANRDLIDEYSVPLLIHSADSPMLDKVEQMELSFFLGAKNSPPPDKFLVEGEKVVIGSVQLEIIHTPGHSPGSVSLMGEDILFSGDTLFFGGVGRTDLPGGSWNELVCSIKEKILTLPEDTIVLTGHGPKTTVGQEKRSNPFIQ
jgi:glyoxylase-like metal-dependent hydrolase (beta-lactamase superfamily II)